MAFFGDQVAANVQTGIQNANFAVFSRLNSQITALFGVIDLIYEEEHTASVETTTYPVETGATLTDHAYVQPISLNLRGHVSDLIIPDFTTVLSNNRDVEAWDRMLVVLNRREPVTVVTLLRTYNNMLITNISTRKNRETGGGLDFTMSLQEVLVSNTQLTNLPQSQVNGAAQDRPGQVNDAQKQSEEVRSTFLLRNREKIEDFFGVGE